MQTGKYQGFARIYVLASEIVAFSNESITEEKIIEVLQTYQTRKILSMEEIWNIGIFIQIAIIQAIADVSKKIYYSQIQKYKVENIFERLIESKPNTEMIFQKKIKNNKNLDIDDLNYSFIEYMIYKLRRIGKKGIQYIEVLEKQVNKLGIKSDEVVKKEHLYVATLKIKIGTCITSIRSINRVNFQKIFEKTNKTEELLNQDPAGVFTNMTEDTKEIYRQKIKEISSKIGISEIYITEEILKLANENKESDNRKKSHVGYYLIDDGYYELKSRLLERKVPIPSKENKQKKYIYANILIPILLSFVIVANIKTSMILKTIIAIIIYVPLFEITTKSINYILSRIVKPIKIPKMNLEEGIGPENKTMVVIPTIVSTEEKIKEMFKQIEIYHLANQDENIYFTLLGDCTTSEKEMENIDKQLIECGKQEAENLNQKYKTKNKFNFLYRKRRWNQGEEQYLGWERKRGLLLQFNDVLLKQGQSDFIVNTLEKFEEQIKYVITLDADTNLSLDQAQKMIGAMSHILNKPQIGEGRVVDGYGIMQPRVGITLEDSQKTMFTKIFACNPGIDFYTNAISDVYQDCFKEGIFTGKGIYDLETYQRIIKNKLPENRILSHDLLEGNYLRCGMLSDIVLLDTFPNKYISYLERENRWIRGDWQIASWLEKKINRRNNPINKLSKFKIFDNLRRSILPIAQILLLAISIKENIIGLSILILSSLFICSILEIINKIIFKKSITEEKIYAEKNFYRNISGIRGSLLRNGLEVTFLPTIAINSLKAIVKTLYRLKKKKKLLEWKTSEFVDKTAENTLESYCKKMIFNILFGILIFGFLNPFAMILGTLWVLGPYIAWVIGIENKKVQNLSKENKKYLLEIARQTWKYFDEKLTEETNYLVPDNYQLGRKNKFVDRTSSTNIGLELLAIISSYDMKFISFDQAKEKLEKVINTIINLDKWNGHLYNWYNIKTLRPLKPEYVSTVDSGNFVGYLYVVKSFLENKDKENSLIDKVNKLIADTDFKVLYSPNSRLFSIGFDIENNKLTDSYYDFLASEARQASFVAIAKKDIKYKHWINLSRTLTSLNGYKGLVSWSGTAFEYLMPNLIVKVPEGSLIDEACKFAKVSQVEYAKRNNIPWGISESAYSLKDLQSNYQYKAFGIPWLGLKRGLEEDLVVSPYSTFLFLEYNIQEGIDNLRKLEDLDMRGEYGFYDSVDFTKERLGQHKSYEPVKTYMAHHQGLIINSINNIVNKDILKRRFMSNPEIKAVEILLNERMPESVVLSKEKTKKMPKGKYVNKYDDREIIYTKENDFKRINAISSEDYTSVIDTKGKGYSKYKDIQINRNRNRLDDKEGIGFFLKNMRNKKSWSSFESDEIVFSQYKEDFFKREENIESLMTVFLVPDEPAEIRQLTIKNKGILREELEVYGYLEPLISNIKADIAHPAYNNMFLKFEYEKGIVIASRKIDDKKIYLGVKLLTDNINEIELELEKEKFWGRNYTFPKAVIDSSNFSNEVRENVEPVIALKTKIEIEPKEKQELNLIIYMSEDKEELINKIEDINLENVNSILELAKAKSEEEIKFLELNGEKIENNQKLLGHCLEKDIPKTVDIDYRIEDVWKFGISGDNPIILAEIKNTEEIYLIDELLETIEFFNVKNIRIDLCILNNEKVSYETFVKDEINDCIKNHRLEYLRNNQIFIFNKTELTKQDTEIIKAISSITLNGETGGIKNNLDEIEKKEKVKIERIFKQESQNEKIEKEEVLFENSFGGFKENEYIINVEAGNVPPRSWSNIIANQKMGTITTENSGGYTWINNSRLNRITTWENDAIKDFQTESIIIKDTDKKEFWKFGSDSNSNSYQVRFGQGYSKYTQINNDIVQENNIFIPINAEVKINHITLKNRLPESRRLSIYYALNLSMGEERNKNIGKVKVTQKDNFITLENTCKSEFGDKIELTASIPIKSYANNKSEFFDEDMNVIGVNKKELKSEGNISIENEVIIEIPVELEGYEKKNVNIILGKNVSEFFEEEKVEKAFGEVEDYWNQKTSIIKVKTPSEKINLYMNYWLIYQTLTSRIYGRTGFYQSGGAVGYRDQLQDTLGMKWIDITLLENQIIKAAKHQFKEGDVMHWWHEHNQSGIRTKISDDLLWLPYSVLEYIEFTEDMSILDKEVEYTCGIELEDGEDEKYSRYEYTEEKENIYEHCMKAIRRKLDFGENGFPKMGAGDWNDGMNTVGNKGKGESIWLGFFLYDILNRWDKILEYKGKQSEKEEFEKLKNELKKSLNQNGWDGNWYKRAINDEGQVIGSSSSRECKIDSIAQSWSIISEAGNNDKKYIALDSAQKHLIDEEHGLIKLLTPGFKGEEMKPGYIAKYPIGVRENGGQYTHAALWLIMAFAKIGFLDQAIKYLEMITPISHTETKEKTKIYKIEPYVLPGDIYSNKFMNGRGGWSWYTGSSSWYYKICLENILGLRKKGDKLYLPTNCPENWAHYELQYRYKSNLYNIRISKNPIEDGEKEIYANGQKLQNDYIILKDENKIENIDIKM